MRNFSFLLFFLFSTVTAQPALRLSTLFTEPRLDLSDFSWADNTLSSTLNDRLTRLTKDSDNNIYVIGSRFTSIDEVNENIGAGDHDTIIIKYSDEGNIEWEKVYGNMKEPTLTGNGELEDRGFDISISSDSKLLTSGWSKSENWEGESFVQKTLSDDKFEGQYMRIGLDGNVEAVSRFGVVEDRSIFCYDIIEREDSSIIMTCGGTLLILSFNSAGELESDISTEVLIVPATGSIPKIDPYSVLPVNGIDGIPFLILGTTNGVLQPPINNAEVDYDEMSHTEAVEDMFIAGYTSKSDVNALVPWDLHFGAAGKSGINIGITLDQDRVIAVGFTEDTSWAGTLIEGEPTSFTEARTSCVLMSFVPGTKAEIKSSLRVSIPPKMPATEGGTGFVSDSEVICRLRGVAAIHGGQYLVASGFTRESQDASASTPNKPLLMLYKHVGNGGYKVVDRFIGIASEGSSEFNPLISLSDSMIAVIGQTTGNFTGQTNPQVFKELNALGGYDNFVAVLKIDNQLNLGPTIAFAAIVAVLTVIVFFLIHAIKASSSTAVAGETKTETTPLKSPTSSPPTTTAVTPASTTATATATATVNGGGGGGGSGRKKKGGSSRRKKSGGSGSGRKKSSPKRKASGSPTKRQGSPVRAAGGGSSRKASGGRTVLGQTGNTDSVSTLPSEMLSRLPGSNVNFSDFT